MKRAELTPRHVREVLRADRIDRVAREVEFIAAELRRQRFGAVPEIVIARQDDPDAVRP